jgi:hypothetical protein
MVLRIVIVASLGLSLAVALWQMARPRSAVVLPAPKVPRPELAPASPPVISLELSQLIENARDHQRQERWDDAIVSYEQARVNLSLDQRTLRDDIERNLRVLNAMVSKKQLPKIGEDVEVSPKDKLPEKLSNKQLLEWYPENKVVRSHCLFSSTGKGRNTAWGLKGESNFAYLAEVETTTRVAENNAAGGRIVFEQSFDYVSQSLAISDQTLEFDLANDHVVSILAIAQPLIRIAPPQYAWISRAAFVAQMADPNFKRSLTLLHSHLKQNGMALTEDNQPMEWGVQVDKLSGTKVRVVYINGRGIITIRPLEGHGLDKGDLTRLAHASSQLMDYFIFPAAEKAVGERWIVQADEISGLALPFELGAKVDGSMSLLRAPDKREGETASLAVTGGKVTVRQETDVATQQGRLTIKNGELEFSLQEKIVRSAHLVFEATSLFQSKNHLLFGTERLRDLKVESRYEAQSIR